MTSSDLAQANIDKLAALFPNVVTETRGNDGSLRRAIDYDALRQELSDQIVDGPQERYQLDWPGKRASALAANTPIPKTLRPGRDESVNFDLTRNLFIEGDNLDALKLLQESYLSKVKLIYIDPPYNTGNDFVYEDDFSIRREEHLERTGQRDSEGNRLTTNAETNGRFHSDWLSMLYSRLKLARNLLTPDGAIFISIDDNEVANLKHLCDEVFGADNFVSQIVWQRSKKGDAKLIAKVHEYVLCYARDKTALISAGVWRKEKEGVAAVLAQYEGLRLKLGDDHAAIREAMRAWYRGLPKEDARKAHSHYNWSDARGLYFADNFAGPDDGRVSRPRHDIIHPITGLPCKKPSTGWRWDEAKTRWALEQEPSRIHFGLDETTIPNRKSYLAEITSEPFGSVFYRDGRSATLAVEALVGKGVFPFPKNTDVLEELISLATGNDDIVLDFFAGSGSTGHAVMNLNARTGSSRSFILVQIDEEPAAGSAAFRAGYPTIAAVSRERVRKAGANIAAETGGAEEAHDTGFRALRVDTTNMADVLRAPDETPQLDLSAFESSTKPDRTGEDLLFQVLLNWGLELTLKIQREQIDGREVFLVDDDGLIACFAETISTDVVRTIAKRQPVRAVFRDSAFVTDAERINVEQIFKELAPDTSVKAL